MMFWGLHLEPGKRYSQNVMKAFHITHATIGRVGGSPIVEWLVSVRAVVNDSDYVLCYLGRVDEGGSNAILQQSLNLEVAEGEDIELYTQPVDPNCKESYVIHLTGHYNDDLYAPTESELMEAAMDAESDGSFVPADEDSSDEEVPELIDDRKRRNTASSPPSKKKKKDTVEAKTEVTPNKKRKASSTRTKGGTEVVEVEEGSGRVAKSGRKVFVKYTGRLASNNQIFDSNMDKKRPFMFRMGIGEVIKGWDEGLQGMKVGGKRKLTIPPSQGYGAKGSQPQIPPNSTLVFDVELIEVK